MTETTKPTYFVQVMPLPANFVANKILELTQPDNIEKGALLVRDVTIVRIANADFLLILWTSI